MKKFLPRNFKAIRKKLIIFAIANFLIVPAFAQKYADMMQDESINFYDVQNEAQKYFDSAGTGRGKGYKQYKRWEYETMLNMDEHGNRLTNKKIAEETQKARARFNNARTSKIAATNWTELGPSYKNTTSGWNPGVGRVTAIAVEPVNKQIIYVGTPEGGLWKSTNGGTSWAPLFDQYNDMRIYSIAMDPSNSNIVYVGTEGSGIYKTTNGGSSWTTNTFTNYRIGKIIINPGNTAMLLAATDDGIFRSTNSGGLWTRTATYYVEDIEFKPGDANTVYATGDYAYRSTNNGQNWGQITNGMVGSGRSLVAVTPANPNYVYIVQASGSAYGRTFRSTDSGNSFTVTHSGSPGNNNLFGYETDGTDEGGQAWYDMAMCVSPTNANEVHVAGIICWKSTTGGYNFTATTGWYWGNGVGYNHADVHVLEYVGNTIYSGTDGGIYKSTNAGDDWTDLSNGLGIRQFYRIGVCKTDPEKVSGGAQDNGTSVYRNGTWKDWLGADGMESFIDHNNSNILYGTSQGGSLYKSTDGGNSYFNLNAPAEDGNWVTPFTMDPNTNSTIYVGFVQIYKSTNGGSNWSQISNFAGTTKLNDIQIAASNGNYIYIIRGSSMYVTRNGGSTWSALAGSPSGNPNSIAVNPNNPEMIALATSTGKVYLSTNGGSTWNNYFGSLPNTSAYKVVFDNRSQNGIYVGMTRGVYYRDNTMSDWTPYISNLPYAPVYDLEFHAQSNRIYAGTHGRGLWWAPAYGTVQPPIECNNLPGIPFGSTPAWGDGSNTYHKVFDGNVNSYFDYVNANGGIVGLDLGGQKVINGIRYYPRVDLADRMLGGKFQASNSADFSSGVVDLYTISVIPTYGWNETTINNNNKYRYIRYVSPNNSYGNVAEIQICGINVKPTVSITSPVNNVTFITPATVNINASASDPDGSISKVKFYYDGKFIGEDNSAPFTYSWAGVGAGTYQLTARAFDNSGDSATSSVINIKGFLVCNKLSGSPFGTSPAWNNGSNTFDKAFDGDITTAFDYANANGGYTGLDLGGQKTINGIRFHARANWASRMVGGKFQASNTSDFSSGVVDLYTITGTPSYEWQEFSVTTSTKYRYVRYLSPNNGFCNIAEIEICGVNLSPTASITAPANNASYTAPANITISATAGDPDGIITKVEFYKNGEYLGEDNSSPYSFAWNNVAVGNYQLTVKAISNDNGSTTSSVVNVTVNNALPTVAITTPTNNAEFTAPASVNITATAADANGTISKVEFYKDGVYLGEDATSPYSFAWNNVAVGNYQLTAKAIDNHNGSTTSSIVNIIVNNALPTVAITVPANNAEFTAPASVNLTATAADANGTISKVEFYKDGVYLGEDASSPYSFAWNNVAVGNYQLTAKAIDNHNESTTSSVVNITVNNALPTVTITAPANNAEFTAPASITITATANDANGIISKVEFYKDGVYLGEDASSPYSFPWNNVAVGNYQLTAKAIDNHNESTTSSVVNITVNNALPTVTITAPANNAEFTAPASITITATANDANGIISKVEFYKDGVYLGEDASSPYSFAWNNVAVGNYQLTAKAIDNHNGSTTSSVVNITVNNALPTVTITAPANNAEFTAPASVNITATANDANGTISKVEFYKDGVYLGEDATSPYSFAWNNVAVGNYQLTAKAIDNHNGSTTSSIVNIIVNNALPTVAITAPANNAEFTAPASVNITAIAADANGTISKVEFYKDGVYLGEDASSPYSFAWNNVAVGNYQLTAKAIDNHNGSTTSSIVNIIVNNALPTVAITAPANNAEFTAPASITITATANDADGNISMVEFYNGNEYLGAATSSPYSIGWNNISAGTYQLTAKAIDNLGESSTSEVVTIIIKLSGTEECGTIAPWNSSAIYATGNLVSYDNHKYQAIAWTQNNVPVSSATHWEHIGECIFGTEIASLTTVSMIPSGPVTLLISQSLSMDITGLSPGTATEVTYILYKGTSNKESIVKTAPDLSGEWFPSEIGDYQLQAIVKNESGLLIYANPVDITVTQATGYLNSYSTGSINVVPNPNHGQFSLEGSIIETMKGSELEVTDILGQIVYKGKVQNVADLISIHNLKAGMYLIKVFNNDKVFLTKFEVR